MTFITTNKRPLLLTVFVVLVLSTFLFVAWRPIHVLMMPQWRRSIEFQFPALKTLEEEPLPDTPDGRACAPYHKIRLYLSNDLMRRPRWTLEDAKYLDALIRAGYPTERFFSEEAYEGMHEDMFRTAAQQSAVRKVIGRMGLGAPIDDDARRLLEQTLRDELTNSFEPRRSDAAYSSIHYRAVNNPEIRQWVEATLPTLTGQNRLLVTKALQKLDEGTEAVKKYKTIKEGRNDATKP